VWAKWTNGVPANGSLGVGGVSPADIAPPTWLCFDGPRLANINQTLRNLIDDDRLPLDLPTRGHIMALVASARFSDQKRTVAEWGKNFVDVTGMRHPSRQNEFLTAATVLDAAEWHVVKHTAQGEWMVGTTTAEYLADIRAAVSHPCSILHIGLAQIPCGAHDTRQSSQAAVCTDMVTAAPVLNKATVKAGCYLFTVYDTGQLRLKTCYRSAVNSVNKKLEAWANHRVFAP
jgi:hypothetical protein